MYNAVFYVEGKLPERWSITTAREIKEILGEEWDDAMMHFLNGAEGYKYNHEIADKAMKIFEYNIFITNMVSFLDNAIAWNKAEKRSLIWIYENGGWVNIHELTNKELRQGHNIEKIYRNGGLGYGE